MDNYDRWFHKPLEDQEKEERDSRVVKCTACGRWIHEGDYYYPVTDQEIYCEECIELSESIREKDIWQ